jgi:hypothetical protein
MHAPPLSWCQALEAEYVALYGAPALDRTAPADSAARLRLVHRSLSARRPTALCLSGGGIRSATFSLGVLQGLAHIGVLGHFDYLSTVSGGGYIGGWLTTWLHRQGPAHRTDVFRALDPAQAASHRLEHGPSPVERVRRTCRYLAPRGGVVSADVWALLTTMARNLVLNWLVILPLLAAALLIPRLYYGTLIAAERGFDMGACLATGTGAFWFLAAAVAAFAVSMAYLATNFAGLGGAWSQERFLGWFLAPLLGGAVAITFFWAAFPCAIDLLSTLVLSSALPAAGWLVLAGLAARARPAARSLDGASLRIRLGLRSIAAAAAAGPILGAGAYWFASYEFGFGQGEFLRELYAVFAVPLVLGLVLLQMMVFIGIASSELDDAVLEWWSRSGAWIAIAATIWIVAGVLVFYMADLVELGLRQLSTTLALDHQTTSTVVGALVPLLSSLAGLAARGRTANAPPSPIATTLQSVALPVIIWVLLSSIAWANLRATEWLEYHQAGTHPLGAGLGELVRLAAGFVVGGLIMSWFVPANRFSLHGMYRQRLIRTFLGSSREDRRPNAFTGFDANDDLRVHDLADVRPLHIVNATLNAVSSTHVGRHEHQSESFTFSPLHVGNQVLGYRPAAEYGSDGGGTGTGLSLGMALAVSGAAASPAMGIFSSKSRAFLLTLANARLGLWFGNPRSEKTWQNSEPPLGVGPVARELLGLTTDRNPYVYLSDGGHYDNLGLWQMVARRSAVIVVSDAGCDPGYTFDDLSNAIRRIRLDLGIPITFPPLAMSRKGQGSTNLHAAIGVIDYAAVDGPGAPHGTIVYVKATMSGDEPVDVRNFATADPTFPHDSTGNQFFDEARFESYRALGFHSVVSIAGKMVADSGVDGLSTSVRSYVHATETRRHGEERHTP